MAEDDGADGPAGPSHHEQRIRASPLRTYVEGPIVRSLLPPVDGKRVLDAACGPGVTASWLVEEGADVVGVDADERSVAYARREYGDRATFHHADLTEPLSFADDDEFDVVLSQLTLEFLPELSVPVGEFRRVLAPDGVAVVSTNHPFVEFLAARYGVSPSLSGEDGDGGEDDGDDGGGDLFQSTTAGEARYFDVQRLGAAGDAGPAEDAEPAEDAGPAAGRRYRRPLQDVASAFLAEGFAVTDLREGGPTDAVADVHDGLTDRLTAEPPIYLCLRAEPR